MILPEKYQGISEEELKDRIRVQKDKWGADLVILGHHYQRDEVYQFADFTGDSFKLAQDAARQGNARYIVFCGVNFMAEAARILCSDSQRVFLPDHDAGCPMADMATLEEVEDAWDVLSRITDISEIIPVTYMNSSAAIKAFCGAHGGIVCTSSNAGKIFDWAFSKGEKILFFPDEHLGRNTAREKGIPGKDVSLWKREEDNGSLSENDIAGAKVIVWNSYCHVHTHFMIDHIIEARKKYPDAKVIVHPECPEEVVMNSDASGSTEQIIRYVEAAAAGSTIIVGTEVNMVGRLAGRHKNKRVFPLDRSLCPNMFKISLADLCWTLEELGSVNKVHVPTEIAENARIALERMLSHGA